MGKCLREGMKVYAWKTCWWKSWKRIGLYIVFLGTQLNSRNDINPEIHHWIMVANRCY
ncbi:hypothetical protein A483_HHAL012429 [Halyomorpha halys]|nr:hypothetical protein A483_HHAL012429 [Halyomorpha halys]